jgi:hypothetical protein
MSSDKGHKRRNKANFIQSPFENQTVRYSNGKIGHLVFNHLKTGLVFTPLYIGKAK